ncbi:MAG TPA: ABC transporter permease [Gammaproteobacteria bacterium]
MSSATAGDNQQRGWVLEHRLIDDGAVEFVLAGDWRLEQDLPSVDVVVQERLKGASSIRFDVSDLGQWDSGLLTFLAGLHAHCQQHDIVMDLDSLPHGLQHLLTMASSSPEQEVNGHADAGRGMIANLGLQTLELYRGGQDMLRFLGEIAQAIVRLLTGRARFRLAHLWLEIEEVGPKGLGIVSVISFLVGVILAYLGADQLRLVGAQIFIADLVAIGMVREVGALMTGIIIAGRTGAAFAAQLGTMQVNEEIDALRTLGVSPIDFLVLPRMLALMLMVPLLTLYAGFVGMLAGLLVSVSIFDIGVFEYYTETLRALELKHFFVGLSKGTVYGAMVAYAGCLRGMQCGRSAEAVGDAATSAVVTGILLITISASIMTIVYYQLGI